MCSYHSFSCQDFIDALYLIKVFIEYATRVKCHRLKKKKKPPNFSCKLVLHVRVCLYWYERDTQWSQTHSAVFRGSLIFKSYINNLFCLARLWTIYSLSLPEVKKTTSIYKFFKHIQKVSGAHCPNTCTLEDNFVPWKITLHQGSYFLRLEQNFYTFHFWIPGPLLTLLRRQLTVVQRGHLHFDSFVPTQVQSIGS